MSGINPRHLENKYRQAERLSNFIYSAPFSSEVAVHWGERMWVTILKLAGETVRKVHGKEVGPSESTRELTISMLQDLEAKKAPRGPSLEEIAGASGTSSWGVAPPDHLSDGPSPNPGQQDNSVPPVGPSDSSEAPAAGTQVKHEGRKGLPASSPLDAASDGTCSPAGLNLSETQRGGQVSLLPPHQSHSETSVAAARSISHETAAMRMRVLAFLRDNPNCTDEEIAEGTGLPANTARPRRVELMQMGQVVQTGKKVARSGRKANAWSVREAVAS